ncbi:MAG TPA: divergent polysaccharide deacetylase family protein, partial [Stellaceae bacterium]|nr:divergent polysaccharide deacetylase family protein [Stellaceae bacterium]
AARLAELERVARRNGSAIAIGHPHDQTLDALRTWLRDLASKGFVLVPVSAIVKERSGEG